MNVQLFFLSLEDSWHMDTLLHGQEVKARPVSVGSTGAEEVKVEGVSVPWVNEGEVDLEGI